MSYPNGFSILAPSPFHILHKHALNVEKVMQHLIKLFRERQLHNEDQARAAYDAVILYENKADIIKRKLRKLLNQKILIPVDRHDLVNIILLQDSIANKIKDISGLFFLRHMIVIEAWHSSWDDFVKILEKSVQIIVQLNIDLIDMLEAGFHSRMLDVMHAHVAHLDDCEHDHDALLITLRNTLYNCEKDMPTIDVWFYYQLLDRMGDVTNIARRLGFQLIALVSQ